MIDFSDELVEMSLSGDLMQCEFCDIFYSWGTMQCLGKGKAELRSTFDEQNTEVQSVHDSYVLIEFRNEPYAEYDAELDYHPKRFFWQVLPPSDIGGMNFPFVLDLCDIQH